ncbi:PH domain-containing protein [Propioniferax innocua]|uniref:PH (Pleckstrin Homology) domain-containing protein n=1 Tax=Propioniferax innocua TaxID=1753 RepID=A0A542ZB45_9ACTN|nr:PH domain-containing protein [Propioniferax innocua]TQL57563.1 PH (Pleckstrin Homology) domain-containing protein [Propioniferax innocua]
MSGEWDITPLRGFTTRTYQPRVLLWWVVGFSLLLVAGAIAGWVFLGADVRARFTPRQVVFLATLVLGMVAAMLLMALSSVTLNEYGIVVRNGVVTHRWAWYQIDGVRFRDGDPWASALFDTPDGIVRRSLMGIQRTDGERAAAAVVDIRERLQASRQQ